MKSSKSLLAELMNGWCVMHIEGFEELMMFGYAPTAGYFQRVYERSQQVRPEIQSLVAYMALIQTQEICDKIAA